jgi:hypothetical protein
MDVHDEDARALWETDLKNRKTNKTNIPTTLGWLPKAGVAVLLQLFQKNCTPGRAEDLLREIEKVLKHSEATYVRVHQSLALTTLFLRACYATLVRHAPSISMEYELTLG